MPGVVVVAFFEVFSGWPLAKSLSGPSPLPTSIPPVSVATPNIASTIVAILSFVRNIAFNTPCVRITTWAEIVPVA